MHFPLQSSLCVPGTPSNRGCITRGIYPTEERGEVILHRLSPRRHLHAGESRLCGRRRWRRACREEDARRAGRGGGEAESNRSEPLDAPRVTGPARPIKEAEETSLPSSPVDPGEPVIREPPSPSLPHLRRVPGATKRVCRRRRARRSEERARAGEQGPRELLILHVDSFSSNGGVGFSSSSVGGIEVAAA